MASNHFLVILPIFLVAAAFAPTLSSAKQFIVGDEDGWKVGVDYNSWAQGKDFGVGDQLVFKYTAGAHNVYKINETYFRNCTIPAEEQPLTSGDDVIILTAAGKKWYACGVANHCSLGQKLAITVSPQSEAPSPSVAPAQSSTPAQSVAPAQSFAPYYYPNNAIAPSPRNW